MYSEGLEKKGEVFIFSGPHGAGKDTLLNMFVEQTIGATRIVRYTTRPKADGETDQLDYQFIDKENFRRLIKNDDFIEYRHYPDGSTGTLKMDVVNALGSSLVACCSINYHDAKLLKASLQAENMPSTLLFISPCDPGDENTYISMLEKRMRARGRLTDDIPERLARALDYAEDLVADKKMAEIIINADDRKQQAVDSIQRLLSRHVLSQFLTN